MNSSVWETIYRNHRNRVSG